MDFRVFALIVGLALCPGCKPEPAVAEPTPEEPATAEPAGDDDSAATTTAGAACAQVPKDLPLAERCAMAGAVVHTFPNTCVGGCRAVEQMMMCGQAFTEGCKCPEGQCIDEKSGCCRAIKK